LVVGIDDVESSCCSTGFVGGSIVVVVDTVVVDTDTGQLVAVQVMGLV
jgi:hypothetical protein